MPNLTPTEIKAFFEALVYNNIPTDIGYTFVEDEEYTYKHGENRICPLSTEFSNDDKRQAFGRHNDRDWTYHYDETPPRFEWIKLRPYDVRAEIKLNNHQPAPPKLAADWLIQPSQYLDEVFNMFYPTDDIQNGYYAPWPHTKNKLFFRPQEITIWSGFGGHGKTQKITQLSLAFKNSGARVFIASLELLRRQILANMVRQAGGVLVPTRDYIESILKWICEGIILLDHCGTINPDLFFDIITCAVLEFGIDVIVIDNFMQFGIKEDDFDGQGRIIQRLCDFKNKYPVHIHLVAHLRKMPSEYEIPTKQDVRGGVIITDKVENVCIIWRNKQKELMINAGLEEIEKNIKKYSKDKDADAHEIFESIQNKPDMILCVEKNRNGNDRGVNYFGQIPFFFNSETLQFTEHRNQTPYQLVQHSSKPSTK